MKSKLVFFLFLGFIYLLVTAFLFKGYTEQKLGPFKKHYEKVVKEFHQ